MNKGPICGRFMKKTRGQKSRATVPLKSEFSANVGGIRNVRGSTFNEGLSIKTLSTTVNSCWTIPLTSFSPLSLVCPPFFHISAFFTSRVGYLNTKCQIPLSWNPRISGEVEFKDI
jgi:hypothetical protein